MTKLQRTLRSEFPAAEQPLGVHRQHAVMPARHQERARAAAPNYPTTWENLKMADIIGRTPNDGKPFYCNVCGAGIAEYYACEETDCELEDLNAAKARALLPPSELMSPPWENAVTD